MIHNWKIEEIVEERDDFVLVEELLKWPDEHALSMNG